MNVGYHTKCDYVMNYGIRLIFDTLEMYKIRYEHCLEYTLINHEKA